MGRDEDSNVERRGIRERKEDKRGRRSCLDFVHTTGWRGKKCKFEETIYIYIYIWESIPSASLADLPFQFQACSSHELPNIVSV